MKFRFAAGAVAIASGLLIGPVAAHAGNRPAGMGFVIEADAEFGGDDIATIGFTDGSTQGVPAGQGLSVAMGAHYRSNPASPFSVRATAGYKYVTTKADNADIYLGRTVLEVVGNYSWDNGWWVGAGITRHSNIKFDADDLGMDARFDDATGPTFEIGWRWLALSYTQLDYTDEFGDTFDASSVGLTLISRF
ncbi:MAG TPA: hypothetical protein VKB34_14115 [Povalibacter sp.]|nr:hypothetical protein [Povalibacter sp.]